MTDSDPSHASPDRGLLPSKPERRAVVDHDSYFNAQFNARPAYVEPRAFLCPAGDDEMLVAQVGSGVIVGACDPELKIGAAGYVLLPAALLSAFPFFGQTDPEILNEAAQPIEGVIAALKKRGAGKGRIRIRLAGGAALEGMRDDTGIKNAVFVREYLARKGLSVTFDDTGGACVRRVHYFPATGRTVSRILRREEDTLQMQETEKNLNARL